MASPRCNRTRNRALIPPPASGALTTKEAAARLGIRREAVPMLAAAGYLDRAGTGHAEGRIVTLYAVASVDRLAAVLRSR